MIQVKYRKHKKNNKVNNAAAAAAAAATALGVRLVMDSKSNSKSPVGEHHEVSRIAHGDILKTALTNPSEVRSISLTNLPPPAILCQSSWDWPILLLLLSLLWLLWLLLAGASLEEATGEHSNFQPRLESPLRAHHQNADPLRRIRGYRHLEGNTNIQSWPNPILYQL